MNDCGHTAYYEEIETEGHRGHRGRNGMKRDYYPKVRREEGKREYRRTYIANNCNGIYVNTNSRWFVLYMFLENVPFLFVIPLRKLSNIKA